MVSFSDKKGVADAKQKLFQIHPGLLKSLELESITMFPKVAERLKQHNLRPTSIQRSGRIQMIDVI